MNALALIRSAARGLYTHARTGDCQAGDYQSVFRLMTSTNGAAADAVSFGLRLKGPRTQYGATLGALGPLSTAQRSKIVRDLRTNAYHVFPQLLDDATVTAINDAMTRAEGKPFPEASGVPHAAKYDPDRPLAPAYYYRELPPAVQRLMIDQNFIAIATDYLRVDPILHTMLQWISARSSSPSSEAAQMFHYDISSLKWLSFFIYLTDVTSESGAHCLIKGSHRVTDFTTAPLRARGAVRVSDDEVMQAYGPERHVEITGKRGTVFIVDTRCCHKGKHPVAADRRVMQLYFTNSTFGIPGEHHAVINPIPEYREAFARAPRLLHYYPPGG